MDDFRGAARLAQSAKRGPARYPRCIAWWLVLAAAGSSGCSDQNSRFTGIWKASCEDYWGVQIQPAAGGLYSVTFCGLSGCLPPGEWMPDTRIEGDPLYQVVSATTIRIKHSGRGSSTYSRCSADPAWRASPPQ